MTRSGIPTSTLPSPPKAQPPAPPAPAPRPRPRKPRALRRRKKAPPHLPYPIWASRHRKIRRLWILAACLLLTWGAAAHLIPNLMDLVRFDRGTFRIARPLSPTSLELLPASALFNEPPSASSASPTILHLYGLTPASRQTQALERLAEWASSGPITLLAGPTGMRGPSGQLTAAAYLSDGRSLNELLIREGLAAAHPAPGDRLSHWFAHLAATVKINPARPVKR